jgi:hypothetical protein
MADAAQLLALDARIGMQRHDMRQLAQRLLDLLVRDDSNPRDIAARLTVQPESTSVLDAPTDGSERVAARPPDFAWITFNDRLVATGDWRVSQSAA